MGMKGWVQALRRRYNSGPAQSAGATGCFAPKKGREPRSLSLCQAGASHLQPRNLTNPSEENECKAIREERASPGWGTSERAVPHGQHHKSQLCASKCPLASSWYFSVLYSKPASLPVRSRPSSAGAGCSWQTLTAGTPSDVSLASLGCPRHASW